MELQEVLPSAQENLTMTHLQFGSTI